jgi:hypothetical protein
MARDEAPPFGRGEMFWDSSYTPTTQDITDTQHLEGKEWTFEDIDYTLRGAKTVRTGKMVRCRVVRNVGAAALLPKRLASFVADQTTGTKLVGRVDGYTTTTAARGYPIDEFLPSAGCQVNNLCWLVMEGPAVVLSDLAGGANNVLNVGDLVVALTAATSGATTAGRLAPQDLTGATAPLAKQVQNRVGYALTAKTTANTNADVLVDVTKS